MRLMLSCVVIVAFAGLVEAQDAKVKYPPMPEAFSSFGAAVCDDYVYVYGGHIGKTHTYSTEAVTGKFRRLSLSKPAAWEELASGPGIQGLALVSHGGKLYRIGGMEPRNKPDEDADNHSLATCAMFDPKVGKWAPLPDMPAGRSSHDATVIGDQIIVAGGWQSLGTGKKSVWHDTTLVLDLSKSPLQWQSIKQPFKRRALNVAALEGKLYVIGGMGPEGTEKTVDVFDVKSQSWSKGPELPGTARNGFTPAACVNAGKIYVSPADGKLYRLSSKRDAWEQIGELEQRRIVHRIIPAGANALLALGGAAGSKNVAEVESLNVSLR